MQIHLLEGISLEYLEGDDTWRGSAVTGRQLLCLTPHCCNFGSGDVEKGGREWNVKAYGDSRNGLLGKHHSSRDEQNSDG